MIARRVPFAGFNTRRDENVGCWRGKIPSTTYDEPPMFHVAFAVLFWETCIPRSFAISLFSGDA